MKLPKLLCTIAIFACLKTIFAKTSNDGSPHVCIIGGGIAAASTAHFLSEPSLTPKPRLTIFEKSERLGGRVSTLKLNTSEGEVIIEAGASIIASANELFTYFKDLLGFSKKDTPSRTFGLWDGKIFVTRSDPTSKFRTQLKLLLRYKRSILRMKQFVRDLTKQYSSVYPVDNAPWPPRENVEALFAGAPELFNLSQISFDKIVEQEFNDVFAREMVAAITRVNYGQDPQQMNGFSGSVGLAGSGGGLWSIEGGNEQIIEGLIKRSGADVLLSTPVQRVTISEDGTNRKYLVHSDASKWTCSAVVMAVPFELAGIELPEIFAKQFDIERKFQRTDTTFVQGFLNNKTFGTSPPDSVLTIENVSEPFTAIGLAWRGGGSEEIPLFKVFSKQPLDEQALQRIFGDSHQVIAHYPWLAYPQFSPPEKFPPFNADAADHGAFFYTSPIESLGSAMEQSAVSGANAAALVKDYFGLSEDLEQPISEKEEL